MGRPGDGLSYTSGHTQKTREGTHTFCVWRGNRRETEKGGGGLQHRELPRRIPRSIPCRH